MPKKVTSERSSGALVRPMCPMRKAPRLAVLSAALLCLLSVSAPSLACGGAESPPPQRPVSTREQADRLLREASQNEREADELLVSAKTLSARAILLRDRAQKLTGRARVELLADAADLDRDAAEARASAASHRVVAARLREEATRVLAGNPSPRPPGWKPPGWKSPQPVVAIF